MKKQNNESVTVRPLLSKMGVFWFLVIVSVTTCSVGGEKILAMFPFIGKSHFYVFEPVLAELARRGHDVTVVSQNPRANPMERYTDINVRDILGNEVFADIKDFVNGISFSPSMRKGMFDTILGFEKVFQDKRIENVLNSTNKFDLVITELFVTDMFIGFSHRLGTPLISMISSVVVPWSTDRFAIPDNPSYIRASLNRGAGQMSFYERVENSFALVLGKWFYSYCMTSNDERVNRKYLGADMPRVTDMIKNTSLFLVNSHFSINGARPFPPQVIEIGGIHIKSAKPLPRDIEKFINESEHGVIYFSFGSVTNGSSMSESMRNAFCNNFAKLKQRVLWKWELDEMPEKPDNVKILKWMPQRDILAHPNVRLFIGHGGLLGTIEAVYNAVPMLCIPVFGDQYQNSANLVNAGTAEQLELSKITEESVSMKLNALLSEPKYKMKAQHLSQIFRDRPASPMDTAVYWIEYVMRHKGAHHLRTAAVDLPWFQYLLLDIILAFIVSIILVISVFICAIKLVLRKVCVKRKEKAN